jgi:phosphoribosylaminoimidazolecarboxamide formyltransferase / IMP cyclohydrolase
MSELRKIKRALISVSDKTGVVEFAKELTKYGVEIISTGGTAKALRDAGLTVTEVSEITEFPEMMDGRVKTLHPKIHGAFLALRDDENHVAAMKEHGIEPIDLYPFEKTVENEDVSLAEAVEQIDIGGPAMIRSAAKNWRDVAIVVSPMLYEVVLKQMRKNKGATPLVLRQMLAVIAFMRTTAYDAGIAAFLQDQIDITKVSPEISMPVLAAGMSFAPEDEFEDLNDDDFEDDDFEDEDFDADLRESLEKLIGGNGAALDAEDFDEDQTFFPEEDLLLSKIKDLRYGENPHQPAALYSLEEERGGVAQAEILQGKEMSFNNYLDADAAWKLISDFDETACAIIKHTNPSGVGVGANPAEAHARALATDPVSAFGGIVAFNRTVDAETAKAVNEVFTEVVLAPDFEPEALEVFGKKKNLRVLRVEPVERESDEIPNIDYRRISGGMLLQIADEKTVTENDWRVVTERKPTDEEVRAMLFAWKVCKHVKSNAIVFANENQTVGVGAGQMNRVDSVRIAATRAERFNLPLENSVLASDAFFPFRDNVDEAAKFGVSAIIQPGGSIKDEESIQAANEHGIAMVFTGFRHFKH